MGETTLDLHILRSLRSQPMHGYALAQRLAEEADRATVYRRLAALRRSGLIATQTQRGDGPPRKAYRLSAAGEERLRQELRDAMRLLLEDFGARMRLRGGGEPERPPRPPIVFVSGSRVSGIEARIVASLARAHPGRVHLVATAAAGALSSMRVEGSWTSIPFRDRHANTLFVNELPPSPLLPAAAKEWARVLAPGGSLNVIAPAPLPLGLDPFVDHLVALRDELHPDSAKAPMTAVVTRTLSRWFDRVEESREADQRIWTAEARTAGERS